jgi:hypothetical protein
MKSSKKKNKQLITLSLIGITTILLAVNLSGCLSEESERDNLDNELSKFFGIWQPTIRAQGTYRSLIFRQNGTFTYHYHFQLLGSNTSSCINGTYEIKDEKLMFTDVSGEITSCNYSFSENNTSLTLGLPNLAGWNHFEKTSPLNLTEDGIKIYNKFNGYQWSWYCWKHEIKFTLWREHITKIEKTGSFWLIEGLSSDRNDTSKNVSSDETGRILIIYDEINDIVTDRLKGGEIPISPKISDNGKITNPTTLVYC